MDTIISFFKSKPARFRVPLILLLIWELVDIASIFIGGLVQIDMYWILANLCRLAIAALNIWFLKAFFIDGKYNLYGIFRKYVGYAIVFAYCAMNLPVLYLQEQGLISDSNAAVILYLTIFQAALMSALWLSLRLKKSQVYWGWITEAEAADKKLYQSRLRKRRGGILGVILDNLDMFVQIIFQIILLQQLIFQMYVIPSESMVPTFLKGDRVLVVKTLDGPKIPMSNLQLPYGTVLEPGQIVVFESPAYQPPPLYINVMQQFVFFMTLSMVDLDRDASGNPKVHFIVKRVIGVPGDKLMMVDDVLYRRRAGDTEFKVLENDKLWSHTRLYEEPENTRRRIDSISVSAAQREILNVWDQRKNSLDPQKARAMLIASARNLEADLNRIKPAQIDAFDGAIFGSSSESEVQWVNQSQRWDAIPITPFQIPSSETNISSVDFLVISHMLKVPAYRGKLMAFLTSIKNDLPADASLYNRGSRAVNLMHKQMLAERYQLIVSHILAGDSVETMKKDEKLIAQYRDIQDFGVFLNMYDSRNFPEYPAGEGNYIPNDKYFLIGDNRYNSLDFRFHETMRSHLQRIDSDDSESMSYSSALAPRLLGRERIFGHAVLRAFPFDRFGPINP